MERRKRRRLRLCACRRERTSQKARSAMRMRGRPDVRLIRQMAKANTPPMRLLMSSGPAATKRTCGDCGAPLTFAYYIRPEGHSFGVTLITVPTKRFDQ